MARRVILESSYTFTPSTRTIVIPRIVPKERLLLITNVTSNKVIYNFSDPTLTTTNYFYTQGTSLTPATTTLVLSYNTTQMASGDLIQITVDEPAEMFAPDEAYVDPVGKIRVSEPEALIDTDFEYGLQPTKWETIALLNNRPAFFVNTQVPITLYDITATNGSASLVANTYPSVPPAIGTPVLVTDTTFYAGNGPFLITANNTVGNQNTFTFSARSPYTGTTGSVYNSSLTAAYVGSFYSNTAYSVASVSNSGNIVTIATNEPHGLQLGDGVYVVGSISSTNAPNGSWQVAGITSNTSFQIYVDNAPTGSITGATVYPRPDGFFLHRAFDGGVQFSTGSSAHNNSTIRQTRKYFRYQSGKGIQFSTGTIMKPSFNIDDINNGTGANTTCTVTTKIAHQLQNGVSINVSGANETAYNGNFIVTQVVDAFRFQYNANTVPSATVATGLPSVAVTSWYGASNRLGMFDSQNGMFFEVDGQSLYAVRRKSTTQIAGFSQVINNSSLVTGVTYNGATTKFSKQLSPGDFIVIRGMSYRILDILSDTSMRITPPYRGQTSGTNGVIISKTEDIKIPQSQFNIDKLDGTGPSGLNLDLAKMQMFYIDYSWYGAGTIRYGFRNTEGKVFYCHRFVNSNQNTEAYMRSGNLPARYESTTVAPKTTLGGTMLNSDTTLTVANTVGFPASGTLLIADPAAMEYVSYTGTTATTFTGLTRGQASNTITSTVTNGSANLTTTWSVSQLQKGMLVAATGYIPSGTYISNIVAGSPSVITLSQAAIASGTVSTYFNQMGAVATNHTYSATAPIAIYSHVPQFSPTISHWGSSVVMDGRYDNDKSLIFTYGELSLTSVAPNQAVPLISIRVSPSVDSGITGTLGAKEIINRMQLQLVSLGVLVNGSFLINLVLNGTVSSNTGTLGTWQQTAVGTSSLAQIADHAGTCSITGGENIYGFYAVNSAGAGTYSVQTGELSALREMGNSILGGGYSNTPGTGIYPDGPDVVTIIATNIGSATANVQTRLSWTEAQA